MARKKTKTYLIAARSEYIDAAYCDSTVSYKITKFGAAGTPQGSVQLADCGRKIEWYFGSDEDSEKKIDKAIEILLEFRAALTASRRTTLPHKVSKN